MGKLVRVTAILVVAIAGMVGSAAAQSPSGSPPVAASASAAPVGPAASSVAPGAVLDATCDPFAGADAVGAALAGSVTSVNSAADSYDWKGTALHHVTCQWATDASQVMLEVRDDPYPVDGKRKPTGIDRWGIDGEPLDDLGVKAFTGTTGGEAYVAWAVGLDDRDRTISITSPSLPGEALVALARAVSAGANPGEPGAAPASTAQAGSVPGGLVGTWTVQMISGKTMAELLQDTGARTTELPLTLTLADDGSASFVFDCKPAKGKKPFAWRSTYTSDEAKLDIESSDSTGSCKDKSLGDLFNQLGFTLGLATHPASWTLDGDTLTISGNAGEEIVLVRSAS